MDWGELSLEHLQCKRAKFIPAYITVRLMHINVARGARRDVFHETGPRLRQAGVIQENNVVREPRSRNTPQENLRGERKQSWWAHIENARLLADPKCNLIILILSCLVFLLIGSFDRLF